VWNRSGNLEATFVTLFVQREFNVSLGQSKSAQISKGFALLYPELKPR
jgi:hypothetical protein